MDPQVITTILETIALAGVAWQLRRVGQSQRQASHNQQQVATVLRDLHAEAQASADERERRQRNEAANALHDDETVRMARLIVAALDTLPECQPCRDQLERNLDRRKLYPRQPGGDRLRSYAKPTQDPRGSA
jgi:hypothetical protein